MEYSIVFTNNEASTIYLRRDSEGSGSQSGGFGFSAKLFLNAPSGIIMNTNLNFFSLNSTGLAANSYALAPGETVMFTSTAPVTGTIYNNYVNYPVTTQFTQSIGFNTNPMTANQAFWSKINTGSAAAARAQPADLDFHFEISAVTMKITPPVNVDFTGTKLTRFYIPKNIKAKDFVKSILTMYNLYADIDVNTDKHIIFKTRDTYYDDGAVHDWTDKLVMDIDTTTTFASEEAAKTLLLTYKTASDEINVGYSQATDQVYGEAEFTFTDENTKGEQKMEVIFEPMPITKNDAKGMYVMGVKGKEPKTGIRIVYDGGSRDCTSYNILQGTTVLATPSTYNYAGHFDDPITPSFDLNFNLCQRYFYNDMAYFTNNNLFNLHWRRNVEQIDKGRVMLAYFNLDQLDVLNTNLNDRIWIKDAYWNILNINDYNAAAKSPTQVKLITIDETQTLSPFLFDEPPFPFPPPVDNLRQAAQQSTLSGANFTTSLGSLLLGENNFINPYSYYNLIMGDRNVITGTNNIVIGDDMEIVADKSIFVNDGDLTMYRTFLDVVSPETYTQSMFVNIDHTTESMSFGHRTGDAGFNSVVLNGEDASPNEASGLHSLASGFGSDATGVAAAAFNQSHATGDYSTASGKAATASHWAEWAHSSSLGGQYGFLSYITVTTDGTEKEMNLDGNLFIDGFEYFTIPVDTVYRVVITAIARDANFECKEFSGVGVIKNVGGTTSLVSAITMATSDQDAPMTAATMSVTADDANDRLAVKVTGILQSPPLEIHWFVKVAYIQVL